MLSSMPVSFYIPRSDGVSPHMVMLILLALMSVVYAALILTYGFYSVYRPLAAALESRRRSLFAEGVEVQPLPPIWRRRGCLMEIISEHFHAIARRCAVLASVTIIVLSYVPSLSGRVVTEITVALIAFFLVVPASFGAVLVLIFLGVCIFVRRAKRSEFTATNDG